MNTKAWAIVDEKGKITRKSINGSLDWLLPMSIYPTKKHAKIHLGLYTKDHKIIQVTIH